MHTIDITPQKLLPGTTQQKPGLLLTPAEGGGIDLLELATRPERYLTFSITVHEEHSCVMNLFFWEKGDGQEDGAPAEDGGRTGQAEKPRFTVRFGLLPQVPTLVCIDLAWLEADRLFPARNPGQLKVVCHGARCQRENCRRIELKSYPCFHDVSLEITDIQLQDQPPQSYPLPDVKLADEFGQWKPKTWPGKVARLEDYAPAMRAEAQAAQAQDALQYPFATWDEYGGDATQPLGEGSGFFRTVKQNGRWFLATPAGNAFFSMGPDCVRPGPDCRVDHIEKWLDWLPDADDAEYGNLFRIRENGQVGSQGDMVRSFGYAEANMQKALGPGWYASWQKMAPALLRAAGMNSLGNWSDPALFGAAKMPYVDSLPTFPATKTLIFRDFPDVYDEEYTKNAEEAAKALLPRRDDPYMIGYFLRNEPAWAFVDNLIIADEVLYNPAQSACRAALIKDLREKYGDIAALNSAWAQSFASFDALAQPMQNASAFSPAAKEDLKAFSRKMLRRYVSIPATACRKADPNHLNLGMRWAWISDPDIVTGWENFDVFSINCYSLDPTKALDNVRNNGVDLPVVIGEYHFGALDAGQTATGLEAVPDQHNRALAYRHYTQRAAAHPQGVGCHWFQYSDQFALGRFDGENYNIGLVDLFGRMYPEMKDASLASAQAVYAIMAGKAQPTEELPQTIPMIAY